MEKQQTITSEDWQKMEKEDKDAEKIARPSLTFLQDGWRKLKANKIAICCLVFIILLTLVAIFVPFFYRYSYFEQNLTFANTPSRLKVNKVDDETCVYITPQYTLIATDTKGNLLETAQAGKKDLIKKQNYYTLNGHALVVDYSLYANAVKEYKKLEQSGANSFSWDSAAYLETYHKQHPSKEETISLRQAKIILENKMSRVSLLCDGKECTEHLTLHNKTYPLGSDALGRDLFIRIVYGARISLIVGIIAALINFVVGVLYGGIAGYFGGNVDNIMMRIVDTIDSIPTTLYVILLMVIVGSGLTSIILALGLTFWVRMARIVRGQVMSLKKQEFVKAAIVVGADVKQIMLKHLIPNMMGPIMVNIAMQIPSAIFNEAFLSFIGLGISAPMASWGTLCNDALAGIYVYPYQMLYPALAISLTILTFNLLSDGLRDAFDPKLTK